VLSALPGQHCRIISPHHQLSQRLLLLHFKVSMASIELSCLSTAGARTSRRQAAAFGNIRTTSVRLISR
jgi:hypothetical protein